MKITDVKATWLGYAIPEDKQHVSDFGRLTTFPNCTILECSLGFNPMLHELVHESPVVRNGYMFIPERPLLGVTLNEEFVRQYQVTGYR